MSYINEFQEEFIILIFSYIILLFGLAVYCKKTDLINNILLLSATYMVFIILLLIISCIFESDILYENATIPFLINNLLIPIVSIALVLLISTLSAYFFKLRTGKKIDFAAKIMEKNKNKVKKTYIKDLERKISHVLIFLTFLLIWIIGFYVILNSKYPDEAREGMFPDNNNMGEIFINLMKNEEDVGEIILSLGWFYYLIFFAMYSFALVMIINEISRKNNFLSFPFTLIPNLILVDEEKQNYGTYVFFAVGQMFAALTCPPLIYLSVLGMSSLADMMTSQIGIRYGKHKIRWNPKKSWEGNIAGVLTAFLLCYTFVGLIWAIIFSIAFFIIDIITRSPLNASDNLLIPFICALLYLMIRFIFDLSYFNPILNLMN